MEQEKSKTPLQIILERTKWEDINEEHNLIPMEKEILQSKVNDEVGRSYAIEVEGIVYSNINEASDKLGIGYYTLWDWLNGRRKSKLSCSKII